MGAQSVMAAFGFPREVSFRRSFQFNLGRLFLLMFVVALILACLSVAERWARNERVVLFGRAKSDRFLWYEYHSGRVREGADPPCSCWEQTATLPDTVARWQLVRLSNADLAHLQGLRQLHALYLNNSDVTDAGMVYLQTFPNLEELWAQNTGIGDAGMGYVGRVSTLRTLYLSNTYVTDAGLKELSALTNLQKLSLASTRVTDAGLGHLKRLQKLEDLSLEDTRVTDRGLLRLRTLSSLRALSLGSTCLEPLGIGILRRPGLV